MTLAFEALKARLLANPAVKTEYDALAPEFEIAAELRRASARPAVAGGDRRADERQPVDDHADRKRRDAP